MYVANLGKYNEGILQGAWFTLPVELSEIKRKIGIDEEYEEWAIHDYESPFKIGEYDDIENLNEIAEEIDYMPDIVLENIDILIGWFDNSIQELIDNYADDLFILKDISNESELGENYIENLDLKLPEILGGVPLESYLDYELIGRDININTSYGILIDGYWIEHKK
ncbi:antirestriction protein ArdA [Pseudolactococcus yaeyamensis]